VLISVDSSRLGACLLVFAGDGGPTTLDAAPQASEIDATGTPSVLVVIPRRAR
jgi:hypothetical protein